MFTNNNSLPSDNDKANLILADETSKQVGHVQTATVSHLTSHQPVNFNQIPPRTSSIYSRSADVLYILSSIPMVILTWIQFTFNLLVMACIFYGGYKTVCILASDLDKHIEKQSHIMLADIIQCSREYVKNRCALPDSPPAMEGMCDNWKLCMEQDVNHIMKSRETAVILAEILNNFFGSLSDRTIYSCATLFIGSIILTNFMLSWSRLRSEKIHARAK